MTPEDAARLRAVLDRLVREKEIAATWFGRVAQVLDDVEQRRAFRRMAQDEKDQRKILMKHRRELCGALALQVQPQVSTVHREIEAASRPSSARWNEAVRVAAHLAEESRTFAAFASDVVGERSCRIFLKILGQESAARRDDLVRELRRYEAAQGESVAA